MMYKKNRFWYNGEERHLSSWAAKYGLSKSCLYNRIYNLKLPVEQALLTPAFGLHKEKLNKMLVGYVLPNTIGAPSKVDTVTNEALIDETVETCSYFGCKKVLTLLEKLCGDRCINHPKTEPNTL